MVEVKGGEFCFNPIDFGVGFIRVFAGLGLQVFPDFVFEFFDACSSWFGCALANDIIDDEFEVLVYERVFD